MRLLQDLERHLGAELAPTSFFIEEQHNGSASYECNLDFHWALAPAIRLSICGILCYSANWGERVSIGAYLLPFQDRSRLTVPADEDTVLYLPRGREGWVDPIVACGYGGEWSQYDSPERWGI
ncbi:MAG: hypothetical protein HQ515_07025 [Phycisphaeraceae bacterium]|nr:hypothetical protein [Phycisphaeraceae bacterium]